MSRLLFDANEGTPQDITLSGIASAEAFGGVEFDLNITLTGIPSEEAFGALLVSSLFLTLTGIPSEEAFGATTVVPAALDVTLSGIASAEAFGTPRLDLSIQLTGITSTEAFGTLALSGDIQLTGIPSGEAFGLATLQVEIPPATGPSEGRSALTQLNIIGTVLDATAANPNVLNGSIDTGIFSSVVTGGALVAVPAAGYAFNLPASTASITLTTLDAALGNLDIEVSAYIGFRQRPGRQDSAVPFSLAVQSGSTTYANVYTELVGGNLVTYLEIVLAGQSQLKRPISATPVQREQTVTYRMLRVGSRLWVGTGRGLPVTATFNNTLASIELAANTANTLALQTVLQGYTRRPVVTLGGEPILDLQVSSPVAATGTVPARRYPGLVDMVIYGTSGAPRTITNAFEYIPEPGTILVAPSLRSI